MIRVTIDEFLLERLLRFTQTLDLYDVSGHRLGRVIPVDDEMQIPTSRVELDAVLLDRLLNLADPLELCDISGRVLARFFPTVEIPGYEPWLVDFAEEELRQQEESDEKCYTTAEVLAHLKSLG
jgi:hypothetical protein